MLILRAVARALGPQSGPAILLATSLAASTSSNVRTSPRGSRDDLADGRDESDRYIVSSVDVSMTVGPQTAVLARDGIDDIEQDLLPIPVALHKQAVRTPFRERNGLATPWPSPCERLLALPSSQR